MAYNMSLINAEELIATVTKNANIVNLSNGWLELNCTFSKYANIPVVRVNSIESFTYYTNNTEDKDKDGNYVLFNEDIKWHCKNKKDTALVYNTLKELLMKKNII